MSIIDDYFNKLKSTPTDINEHFDTLKEYASKSLHITEMGVRTIISTWALLAGKPKEMVSIDIKHPKDYGADISVVYQACEEEGIKYKFIEASTLDIEIESTDLLFIDTLHTYDQLSKELPLHGNKAQKYIILHDTEHCEDELLPAINEFIENNKEWSIVYDSKINNGLMILSKV